MSRDAFVQKQKERNGACEKREQHRLNEKSHRSVVGFFYPCFFADFFRILVVGGRFFFFHAHSYRFINVIIPILFIYSLGFESQFLSPV